MNKFIGIGRISTDLELRETTNGKSYVRFNLAINRNFTNQEGIRETDFIPVEAWGKQAENLVEYQTKGNLVSVEGSVRVENYQNAEGENKYRTYISAQEVRFLETRKSKNETTEEMAEEPQTENTTEEIDPFAEFADEIEHSEDFPF